MGMFDGIKDAKASMDANYDRDGDYISRIDRVKGGKSRSGDEFVAVEKTIIFVYDDGEGRGHKVGENVTHMMMKKHDSFLGNMKAFVAKCMGCDEEEVDGAACEEIISEDNPMGGMVVHQVNKTIQTRKGNDFTRVSYKGEVEASHLAELLDEDTIGRFFGDGLLEKMIEDEAG